MLEHLRHTPKPSQHSEQRRPDADRANRRRPLLARLISSSLKCGSFSTRETRR